MSINFRITPTEQKYPYLIVRLMSGVYQHVDIYFQDEGSATTGKHFVITCPTPYKDNGGLTDQALETLVNTVKKKVVEESFRMCIVLSKERSLFIEADGPVNEGDSAPSSTMLGTNTEVYNQGEMVTRESATAQTSGSDTGRIPRTYCLVSDDEDGNPVFGEPILTFSDLWNVAVSPYWLLCLSRWMGDPDQNGLVKFSEHCAAQFYDFNHKSRAKHVKAMCDEDIWTWIWHDLELLEQEARDTIGNSSDWSVEMATQFRACVSNPFENNDSIRLPLPFDDIVYNYFNGFPVLNKNDEITFQMQSMLDMGDE